MSRLTLPQGFTVTQLEDKRWYPVKVDRYYSAVNPEGWVRLELLIDVTGNDCQDMSFASRNEAVAACQCQAQEDEEEQQQKWALKARDWDHHPDRCIHYQDVIEEVTGVKPEVFSALDDISVLVRWCLCWQCGQRHFSSFFVDAPTLEEALEEAAQRAYALFNVCVQPVKEREPLTVSV